MTATNVDDLTQQFLASLPAYIRHHVNPTARITLALHRAVRDHGWTIAQLAERCGGDLGVTPGGTITHRLERDCQATPPPTTAAGKAARAHDGCCDNGWIYDDVHYPPRAPERCPGNQPTTATSSAAVQGELVPVMDVPLPPAPTPTAVTAPQPAPPAPPAQPVPDSGGNPPMTTVSDPVAEAALFEVEAPPPVSLADKFGVPPVSVLDRRMGEWQGRRRAWLSLGIQSELGRGDRLTFPSSGFMAEEIDKAGGATSAFDPVLAELACRWFTMPGDRVLDPFAGGSVRGVVCSTLGRYYTGIDLRDEQVAANITQIDICGDTTPQWLVGDAAHLDDTLEQHDPHAEYDMLLSCPPYADLERYSDHPRDLSTMSYPAFLEAHQAAITAACRRLRTDRFAVWVMGDVRDKAGAYRGLVHDTVRAFTQAGLAFHNDAVIQDPLGTARLRAEKYFRTTRKFPRVHQHFLVFCKGDARRATRRLEQA